MEQIVDKLSSQDKNTVEEILEGINEKLVSRHPHVFSKAPGGNFPRLWDIFRS